MRWLVRLANKNYKRTRKSCTHAKCGCSMVSMSLWFYHRFSSEISIKLDSMPWNVALCLFSFSSLHNGKCWKIHFVWVSNDIHKYKESNCKNLRFSLILHFWESTQTSRILLGFKKKINWGRIVGVKESFSHNFNWNQNVSFVSRRQWFNFMLV